MKATRNRSMTVLALGVLWSFAPTAAAYERTVDAKGLSDVRIETISGEVEVRGWDEGTVKVEWTGDAPDETPHLERKGGQLTVGPDPQGHRGGLNADLVVSMPRGLQLIINTISGDIFVEQIRGRSRLVTVSGAVEVKDCASEVSVKSVSGDVRVWKVKGDLAVQTVSGEVEIERLSASLVELKSVSGDIELSAERLGKVRANSHSGEITLRGELAPTGGIRAKSFSGDLRVELPKGSGFELTANTRSGGVRVEQQLDASRLSSNKVSGRAGKGGPELKLESFSGEIDLRIKR